MLIVHSETRPLLSPPGTGRPTDEPPAEPSPEELKERKQQCIKKSIVAVALVGFIIFVIADSLTNGYIRDGINSFLEWIEANAGKRRSS
jgi:hypothetical protein